MFWNNRNPYNDSHSWTHRDVDIQQGECYKRYQSWQNCVKGRGSNDVVCKGSHLEDYYVCIDKLNAMRIHFETNIPRTLNTLA